MKLINLTTTASLAAIMLVGCGGEKPRTSNYYLQNPDEMTEVIDKCSEMSRNGETISDVLSKNCRKAMIASSKMIHSSL
ncbi:EexN family lipoprotein [Psychrobacter sp. AOP1-A1-60]|uniref:EexN family lipoprotein n=1 Tax=Psychrobacter sp. AOP1-A1-60 TaxID=3457727 RepID=UPI004035320E